jgi:hypothetical protein
MDRKAPGHLALLSSIRTWIVERMRRCTRALTLAAMLAPAATLVDSADATPIHCSMTNPSSCPNTSDLKWSPGFAAAVTQFIGSKKVSYFRRNKPLSWQALYGFSGPPEERKSLPGGLLLFAACPAHDCAGQASAVVLDDHGIIKAIGFSSFHCGEYCDFDHRYLDFYVTRGPSVDTIIAALSAWGTGSNIQSMVQDPKADERIHGRVSIHLLP